MVENPYITLGINENATLSEIKHAHRNLAKKYHPDTGGDEEKIVAINAAWEILKNKENREKYARLRRQSKVYIDNYRGRENDSSEKDKEISQWIIIVYKPIDKLIREIINKFPKEIRELSADPYDDKLMESFSKYLNDSKEKINKIKTIYLSLATPDAIKNLSLTLYQCFSEIEDGINEWEMYTKGYVEQYLHDGQEMLRKAKKQHSDIKNNIKYLLIV